MIATANWESNEWLRRVNQALRDDARPGGDQGITGWTLRVDEGRGASIRHNYAERGYEK